MHAHTHTPTLTHPQTNPMDQKEIIYHKSRFYFIRSLSSFVTDQARANVKTMWINKNCHLKMIQDEKTHKNRTTKNQLLSFFNVLENNFLICSRIKKRKQKTIMHKHNTFQPKMFIWYPMPPSDVLSICWQNEPNKQERPVPSGQAHTVTLYSLHQQMHSVLISWWCRVGQLILHCPVNHEGNIGASQVLFTVHDMYVILCWNRSVKRGSQMNQEGRN